MSTRPRPRGSVLALSADLEGIRLEGGLPSCLMSCVRANRANATVLMCTISVQPKHILLLSLLVGRGFMASRGPYSIVTRKAGVSIEKSLSSVGLAERMPF